MSESMLWRSSKCHPPINCHKHFIPNRLFIVRRSLAVRVADRIPAEEAKFGWLVE
jgi:hypothetical protein